MKMNKKKGKSKKMYKTVQNERIGNSKKFLKSFLVEK